jgi:hypothetical protein
MNWRAVADELEKIARQGGLCKAALDPGLARQVLSPKGTKMWSSRALRGVPAPASAPSLSKLRPSKPAALPAGAVRPAPFTGEAVRQPASYPGMAPR